MKKEATKLVKCPNCDGKGEYELISSSLGIKYPVKCDLCGGTGKVDRSSAYRGIRKR